MGNVLWFECRYEKTRKWTNKKVTDRLVGSERKGSRHRREIYRSFSRVHVPFIRIVSHSRSDRRFEIVFITLTKAVKENHQYAKLPTAMRV